MIDLDKADRAIYSAVHGKKVILDALKAAGQGWNHTSGHSFRYVTDSWRRGRWTLLVEWTEHGRIAGATLHEDQVDPDTGHIKIRGNGDVERFLRWGMTGGARQKKERLIRILAAAPEDLSAVAEAVFAEQSTDSQARDAKRRAAYEG
jgi:hypothetical protein